MDVKSIDEIRKISVLPGEGLWVKLDCANLSSLQAQAFLDKTRIALKNLLPEARILVTPKTVEIEKIVFEDRKVLYIDVPDEDLETVKEHIREIVANRMVVEN